MTGAYLRVKRGEKYQAVEVEHLTDAERDQIIGTRKDEEIMRWLHVVCNTLSQVEREHFVRVEETQE